MKDICLVYHKENKVLVKKLVSRLESDAISCWVSPRDYKQEENESLKTAIEDSKIVVLIIDRNSASNKEMIHALSIALENKSEIIPFVLEKTEPNLYSEHFFFAFSWVAAYENSFDEAYDLLVDAYEELSGEKKSIKKINQSRKKNGDEKISKPVVYLLAIIAIAVISYLVYNAFSNSGSSEIIAGKWKISDYKDNLPRNQKDSILIIQTLKDMKANASMTLNDDHTFERRGFSNEPQIGKWDFNSKENILYLEPNGLNRRDKANIENLTDNQFIMVVNELVDSKNVTTRITFTRVEN